MRFPILFACLVLADLIAVSMESKPLEYVFKPSLMLALGIYFLLETAKTQEKKQRNLVLTALFFSLLGDVFLMFPNGFILGLAAFLVGHLFYIFAFMMDNWGFIFSKRDRLVYALGILIYGVIFLSIVIPKVNIDLKMPIVAYGLTILVMLLTALNRWKNVGNETFKWVLIGAILFVISDSLIAISRFVQPFPMSGVAIMLTYSAGQFLIVKGVLVKLNA